MTDNRLGDVASGLHRSGPNLEVRFESLDGYACVVTPIDSDIVSRCLARISADLLQGMLREVLNPLEKVTLLDRLRAGSPVQIRLRPEIEPASIKDIGGEVSLLFFRLLQSRPHARLLSIPQPSFTMDFTTRERLDPPSAAELWPRSAEQESSKSGCPVCDASPAEVQAAYHDADGCSRCGAIFVSEAFR